MGNLQSALSRESQDILDAAVSGDVAWVKRQIVEEPKLISSSVTLVKRRGVLHLAAKQGHSDVISAVLEPLVEAVRQEFNVSGWWSCWRKAHTFDCARLVNQQQQ
jgi:hypothetical protein